ncbi:MAG: NADH-quinone oxidoreductase subunit K [Candidatus Sulfotelmatobacter sp.]
MFVITDAAAEAAVGLGILIAYVRNKEKVNIDEVNLLKW